jgi:hypothetical protein
LLEVIMQLLQRQGGEKMAIPFSSSRGQRFSWEEVCTSAALETDHARIEERIRVAEDTLMARLLELPRVPEYQAEIKALEDALEEMVNLKQERFGHWR